MADAAPACGDRGEEVLNCVSSGAIHVGSLEDGCREGAEGSLTQYLRTQSSTDDEFYRERARHIRELADKADPFIRKRLLNLAGNYDAIIRRSPAKTTSPAMTTLISPDFPKFPRDRPSKDVE
jgi:hypothetical protein